MNPKAQYKDYYDQMFVALQAGNKSVANKFRLEMEALRQHSILSKTLPAFELSTFVQSTLNKNHHDLKIAEPSNCINAAFNFSSPSPTFTPYSTMDFLNIIKSEFQQIEHAEQPGDLVVFWSRMDSTWEDRKIVIEDLDPTHPQFPFGLVFDHVAVYLGQNCLYHKPDPTLESRYQINHWDDVVGFSEVVNGFELTFHRRHP